MHAKIRFYLKHYEKVKMFKYRVFTTLWYKGKGFGLRTNLKLFEDIQEFTRFDAIGDFFAWYVVLIVKAMHCIAFAHKKMQEESVKLKAMVLQAPKSAKVNKCENTIIVCNLQLRNYYYNTWQA